MYRVAIKTIAFSLGAVAVLWWADGPADYATGAVFAVMVLIQGLNALDKTIGAQLRSG